MVPIPGAPGGEARRGGLDSVDRDSVISTCMPPPEMAEVPVPILRQLSAYRNPTSVGFTVCNSCVWAWEPFEALMLLVRKRTHQKHRRHADMIRYSCPVYNKLLGPSIHALIRTEACRIFSSRKCKPGSHTGSHASGTRSVVHPTVPPSLTLVCSPNDGDPSAVHSMESMD